jgi:hypothetical protein
MTRTEAIETAIEYRDTARAMRNKLPGVSKAYYALARKYLRKARDLRVVRPLPNPVHIQMH